MVLVDKAAGLTSHDVVAIARRRLGERSVGHLGTLDPFATGLLVLLVGPATRLARFAAGAAKRYQAEARLGFATVTDDLTGEPAGPEWAGPWPEESRVREAFAALVGPRRQRPPAFSAKSVGGVRSYRRARAGAAVELAEVEVSIDALTVTDYRPPLVAFAAQVGAGTYLRAIARDVGAALGIGAHLTALRRTAVGPFRIEDAVPVGDLSPSTVPIPPVRLLADFAAVDLSEDELGRVRHGREVGVAGASSGPAALLHRGELVAVAEARAGRWQPVVVLGGAA